ESPAKSRSQSPSKNRVQELAGRFDEIESDSRRNSANSLGSRNSWKEGAQQLQTEHRPPLQSEPSFRPKLPGQWDSFATERPESTPVEDEADRGIELPNFAQTSSMDPIGHDEAAEVDLAPTTTTHKLSSSPEKDATPSFSDNPMAALTAAGAAMGDAIRTTLGGGTGVRTSSESSGWSSPASETHPDEPVQDSTRLATGDIYGRPPAVRIQSAISNASTIPPTPPPKDEDPMAQHVESDSHRPYSEVAPPVPLKSREATPAAEEASIVPLASNPRPQLVPQLSTDFAHDDSENDRLRKDIVRALSPEADRPDMLGFTDQPGARESNLIPSEYGDYWEGTAPDGSRYSQMIGDSDASPSGVEMKRPEDIREESPEPAAESPKRFGLLDSRFSWEKKRESDGLGAIVGLGSPTAFAGASAAQETAHLANQRLAEQ
ncbi:MAG: hypothetical protein INR71_16355, partial [Terriglobus roseus]|nr:hypothetical protein [Terriglobus roseus]